MWSIVATTAGLPSRATIALHALSGQVWGASGGTACASVMDMWGLGSRSRSVLYSVWQLLFRTGYFISDYISGKRQMSFPPMKMLFILVVAYFIIGYKQLFGYSLWGTIWRLVFVFSFVYCVTLLLGHLVFFSGEAPDIQVAGQSFPANIFMTCFYVIFGVLILSLGYLINSLATRKGKPQDAYKPAIQLTN